MKKYLMPYKIKKTVGCVENVENLMIEKEKQIGLVENNCAIMKDNSSIILDFGKEICGGIRLLIASFSPVKLRITFGESLSECLSSLNEKNATNDHSLRDYEITTTCLSDIETGQTGFRFVKIEKLTKEESLSIKNIYAVSFYSYITTKNSFNCDDLLINDIFHTAARTADLCVQNGYVWDGIKRDRLVWIGDLYPEFLSLSYLHCNVKEIEKSLLFAKNQTELPLWINNIPSYSLWWLIICYQYCLKIQNFTFCKNNQDYITKLTDIILENIDDKGNTLFEFNFFDWASSQSEDEIVGVAAITMLCLENVINLYKVLVLNFSLIEKKLELLKKKEYKVKEKKQVKALLSIVKNEFNDETLQFLTKNNSSGFSTFMSYFILTAIFKSGGKDKSIELTKEYYGTMLKYGATTFFEDFDISWSLNAFGIDCLPQKGKKDLHGDEGNHCYKGFRHSLCHGWSSGVIAFIVENIIGISSNEKREIVINPYLSTISHLKYKYPYKNGFIKIELEKKGTKTFCKIDNPFKVKIVVKNAILK